MADEKAARQKKGAIAAGVFGIILELVAVALLASNQITVAVAIPLLLAGMLVAFVPLLVVARRARR